MDELVYLEFKQVKKKQLVRYIRYAVAFNQKLLVDEKL